ncbi:MAG TPA: 50S ribosomal protein L18 [Oligoflexia bacterium]|nr:50S ribosomal protein L18 [Oligoflexia bacterium]HMR25757.1 50S ribosomal protein L18 [Oligoflexia bacterium]
MKKNHSRSARTRYKLRKVSSRPRLSVFRSNKHIYAQIIDDKSNETLAFASTLSKELKGKFSSLTIDAAKSVGQLIAEKAKANKVEQVCFDRGSYPFHGRVEALATAAREHGLKF